MLFEELLERLGETTGRGIRHALAMLEDGLIDQTQCKAAITHLIELGAVQSNAAGQAAYSAVRAQMLTGATEAAALPTMPASSAVQQGKVAQAVDSIFSGDPELWAMRLERLGNAKTIREAQASYGKKLRADKLATGWKRGLNADACQLCRWWWREGRIWPRSHAMPTHKGCKCQQVPVFRGK